MKFLTGLIFGLLLASAVADEIKEYDCPPDGKIIVTIYPGGGGGWHR